jgi:hypothetical protein
MIKVVELWEKYVLYLFRNTNKCIAGFYIHKLLSNKKL